MAARKENEAVVEPEGICVWWESEVRRLVLCLTRIWRQSP
jgi:hypothetical protein